MKPCIRKWRFVKLYSCRTYGCDALGRTPEEAYDNWLAKHKNMMALKR